LSIDIPTPRIHPFMAEGLKDLPPNSSGTFTHDELLAHSVNCPKDNSDGVSPLDFDENYLMFGGDTYLKDRPDPNTPMKNEDLIKGYKQRFKFKFEKHRRMSVKINYHTINKLKSNRSSTKSKLSVEKSAKLTLSEVIR